MSVGPGVSTAEAGVNIAQVIAKAPEAKSAGLPPVAPATEAAGNPPPATEPISENALPSQAQITEAPSTQGEASPGPQAEVLTSDENLPIEDRLSNAVGNRVSEENKLKELETSGADKDTIHAQERKVWEARTHEGDLSHQRDASQMEQRLTEQVQLITKEFEAREISFNEKIDNLTRALQERDKLLEQVIGTIKDEDKKHILLEALKLLGIALIGGTVEVASETKAAAVETTGAKA